MSPPDLHDRLQSGERLIWSGAPAQGLLLTTQDWYLVPFSLVWGGFVIFWEFTALTQQTNGNAFMAVWGIPFMLVGLYLIIGRFLIDAWVRSGMAYAVTNKRILILRSPPFSNFTSVAIDRLPDASLKEGSDGRGTIRFSPSIPVWGRRGFSSWTPSLDPTPQFLGIENARSVFDQIQSATQAKTA
jgi:hypothetical protein